MQHVWQIIDGRKLPLTLVNQDFVAELIVQSSASHY